MNVKNYFHDRQTLSRVIEIMKTKNNDAEKLTLKKKPNSNRGEETRRMILGAATKVFSRHTYNAASIRMIAAQGEFQHGLIRYHFPSKAKIFESVIGEACQNIRRANKVWISEISKVSVEKGLALYIERFIEFFHNHPEMFRIVIHIISHDDPVSLPGYSHLVNLVTNTQKDWEKSFKGIMPKNERRRIFNSLNILIFHYLGGVAFEAGILDMDPKSDEYFQWIKETIILVFLPIIKKTMDSY